MWLRRCIWLTFGDADTAEGAGSRNRRPADARARLGVAADPGRSPVDPSAGIVIANDTFATIPPHRLRFSQDYAEITHDFDDAALQAYAEERSSAMAERAHDRFESGARGSEERRRRLHAVPRARDRICAGRFGRIFAQVGSS